MEAIKAACHNMSMDADYDTSVDNCKILIDMATKLYELYQQPNPIITEFSKWLLDSISKIITKGIENFQLGHINLITCLSSPPSPNFCSSGLLILFLLSMRMVCSI